MNKTNKITAEKPEPKRNNQSSLVQKKERIKNKAVPAADNILDLQRTIGNQAVQRMFKSGTLQAKLKIGRPNDKYEKEADRIADQVMRMPEMTECLECNGKGEEPLQTKPITTEITPLVRRQIKPEEEEEKEIQTKPISEQITPVVQRQTEEEKEEESIQPKLLSTESPVLQRQTEPEEEEEEEPLQAKLDSSILQKQIEPEGEEKEIQPKSIIEEVSPLVQKQDKEEEEEELVQTKGDNSNTSASINGIESRVNSLKGGGQPLPESTRKYFEPRFGYDFSGVRVHNDSKASETAKTINAKAFTTGTNIVFNAGQYSPETDSGKRLLAHELTHVVQQNGSSPANINSSRNNNAGSFLLRNILGQKKLLEKDASLDIGLKTEGEQDTDLDMDAAKQTGESTEGVKAKSIIRETSPSVQRYDEEETEDDELEEEETEEEEEMQTKPISEQKSSLVQKQPEEDVQPRIIRQMIFGCTDTATRQINRHNLNYDSVETYLRGILEPNIENIDNINQIDETVMVERQEFGGSKYDIKFRFDQDNSNQIPTVYGETLVIRVLIIAVHAGEELFQPKKLNNYASDVLQNTECKVHSFKGSGHLLEKSVRAFFEPRFGYGFSKVRVHTDSKATDTAKSVNAKAFTIGKNIVFGNSQYSPQTLQGKRLLAHELTHVVQQEGIKSNIRDSFILQRQPEVTLSINSEATNKIKKKVYPPVNWSVNRAKNRKQVLPKAGVTLDEIANFLYGDASAKAELAAENNIDPTDLIVPGQPLLLPVKKLTQAANNDFDKSPMVPAWVGNAEAYVAKKKALDRKLQNDFNFIVKKLDETHYSDSDEGEVIAVLEKWGEEKFVTRPELYPNGGEYLDKLFSKLKMKTKDVGVITTQWTNYYSMIFNHFDRVDEVVAIRERYSKEYKGDRGREELSFGKDVVVKSVVALPGGISAGVGGALKVLPFEFTETIGDALTEQGKEYLKAVGYGDEKMIETAIEWSEFSGAFSAEVVMTATGGNIAKVKKIIDIIEKGEQLLALKKQVESIIKLKDEIPQFLLLFKDREKLFAVVLGLEDEQIINRLEKWALEFSPDVDNKKKAKSKKKKGFKAILARIKNIVDKVRQIFYPIFSVRRRIIDFIGQFAETLSKIPLFNELLEMLLDKEKRPKDLKGLFNQLTDIVAQKFLDKLDEVRNLLMNFIGKGEEFLNSIAISTKEIANVVTDFSLNIIEKQIKMVKALRAFPEIKDLIADRLVKPLLPEEPLKAVNKEIRKVTNQINPVFKFIKERISYIYSRARNAFREQLVPAFKNLFIQTSRTEGDENPVIFDTQKFQSHIMQSSGEKISDNLKEEMEGKFGQDFKEVQIHRDNPSRKANEMLQSNAFTTGKDIYFGEGKYSPDTKHGRRLIAHELSHVVQQKQGRQVNVIQPDSKTFIKKIVAKYSQNILKMIKATIRKPRIGKPLESFNKAYKGRPGLIAKTALGLIKWWKTRLPIRAKGEKHTLFFSGRNENAILMIASSGMPYKTWISRLKATNTKQKKAKTKAIESGEKIDALKKELVKLHRRYQDPKKDEQIKDKADEKQEKMVKLMNKMTTQVMIILEGEEIPEERYLPPDFPVRRRLYIRGSGFTSLSRKLRQDKVQYINEEFKKVRKAPNERTKQNIWEKLLDAELVPEKEQGKEVERDKFVRKNMKKSKLNVDHVESLAKHWKSTGYNTSDEERQRYASIADNFDVIYETYNKVKGSKDDFGNRHYYVEKFFVGKRFSSMVNKSPFGSLKIGGRYFRETLNGKPIKKV